MNEKLAEYSADQKSTATPDIKLLADYDMAHLNLREALDALMFAENDEAKEAAFTAIIKHSGEVDAIGDRLDAS